MVDEAEILRMMNAEISVGFNRWQNRPPAYLVNNGNAYENINVHTYDGAMPTDYGTIMGSSVNAPILSFGGNHGSVASNLTAAGFGLSGCFIDTTVQMKHQAEMAKKAEEAKKESEKGNEGGTGSYTYEVNDKGEITYKKPDGKKCTVTEFQKEAGMAAYRKAAEESKAKKEKS